MLKTALFFKIFGIFELDDFNLSLSGSTSLLISGRNEPMASRKGCCKLLEKAMEKMFQGAV